MKPKLSSSAVTVALCFCFFFCTSFGHWISLPPIKTTWKQIFLFRIIHFKIQNQANKLKYEKHITWNRCSPLLKGVIHLQICEVCKCVNPSLTPTPRILTEPQKIWNAQIPKYQVCYPDINHSSQSAGIQVYLLLQFKNK